MKDTTCQYIVCVAAIASFAGCETASPAPQRECADAPSVAVECYYASECPGAENECAHRVCDRGTCHVLLEPSGTSTIDLVKGDCVATVCDGNGGTDLAFTNDPSDDGNECTVDSCADGANVHVPVELGAQCVLKIDEGLVVGACGAEGTCNAPN